MCPHCVTEAAACHFTVFMQSALWLPVCHIAKEKACACVYKNRKWNHCKFMQNYGWEMEIKIIMTYDMFFSGQGTYQNDFVLLLTFYVKLTLYLRRQKNILIIPWHRNVAVYCNSHWCRTANMSWRTCVVVKQIQSNQSDASWEHPSFS